MLRNFTFGEKIGMLVAGLVFAGFMVFKFAFIMIEEGKLGVNMAGTKYVKEPMQPGYHFFWPIYNKIVQVPNKPIMNNFSKSEGARTDTELLKFDTTISCLDALGNTVEVAISFETQPVGDMMPTMFAKDGTFTAGFFKKVEQPFRSVVRDTIAEFNANTIQSQRASVKEKMIARINISFEKNDYFKLVNDSVNLKELIPSKKVRDLQEKVSLAQQEISVNQKIAESAKATAQGKADAVRIAAQGTADAVTIEAEAQAKANELINKSLTTQLIQYQEVVKWNGVRSKVVAGSGSGFIVDTK